MRIWIGMVRWTSAVMLALALASPASAQVPFGTAFTYQGRLSDGGGAPTGAYDFRFELHSDPTGGPPDDFLTRNDVLVTGGLFTVSLDFGAANYGTPRWLEVQVRPGASTGAYTPLLPRQELTPAPNAQWAKTSYLAFSALNAGNFTGELTGEVTGTQGATYVAGGQSDNVGGALVRRTISGDFGAGTVSLAGNLDLPATSLTGGGIRFGGARFLHNYGAANTFLGASAGNTTLTGTHNTAVGASALVANQAGTSNLALGVNALANNTSGNDNVALGNSALGSGDGTFNTAVGSSAFLYFGYGAPGSSGTHNVAIGYQAGSTLLGGNNNIYVSNCGPLGTYPNCGGSFILEANTIRLGQVQTATYIAGIHGQTSASGVNVLVNNTGKLGTTVSSARYKQEIADLGAETDVLRRLRPVAFYYRPEHDPTHTRQYGLIAEEVAQVAPQLVVYDEAGAPQAVRYHFVNAMLLNEVQKQQARIDDLESRLARVEALLASKEGAAR